MERRQAGGVAQGVVGDGRGELRGRRQVRGVFGEGRGGGGRGVDDEVVVGWMGEGGVEVRLMLVVGVGVGGVGELVVVVMVRRVVRGGRAGARQRRRGALAVRAVGAVLADAARAGRGRGAGVRVRGGDAVAVVELYIRLSVECS